MTETMEPTESTVSRSVAEGEPAPRVSVVIPISDPDVDLLALVQGYSQPLVDNAVPFEFVFVLDGVGSAIDGPLREASLTYPLSVVRLQGGGLGEAIALSSGVSRAVGEYVINAPQYLQSEPEDLIKLIRALDGGADVVATWRSPRVDPWLNRVQSAIFNWILKILMGVRFHDLNSSLRAMRRHVLDEVSVYGDLYRFLPVLAMRQGFRTVEVKVRHREEKGRTGFYGIGVYVRRMLDILAISFLTRFTQKPLRFFGMLGLLAIAVGIGLSIDPLLDKLGGDSLTDRPILVVAAVLIAFGVQLIGFGLVGEIIIFTQARNLRDYRIEEDPPEFAFKPPENPIRLVPPDEQLIHVREIVPGEDARWDAFVRDHPDGSFFLLSGWRKVVHDVFRHQPHVLIAERGGEWVGVLPLFWTKSMFLGNNLVGVPYGVYGGMLWYDEESRAALLAHAEALGRQLNAGFVELRSLKNVQPDLPMSELYVTFRKRLPADADAVMPSIPKKARAEVRRAMNKFGMTCDVEDSIDAFYDLFARNKRQLGSPSLPKHWFQALVDEFGGKVIVHVVRDEQGQAVSAVMSFAHGDTLCAYYSGALLEARKTGVNDFVYCKIMEWAVNHGFSVFDFGRSRADTGAAKFKKHMGFESEPLNYQYLLVGVDAKLPEFHPSNPKLGAAQRVWRRLPLWISSRLGSRLSRHLP